MTLADYAKDVFQDSLIKNIKNICQYRKQGRFPNWLVTFTVNTCLKELKKYRHSENLYSVLEEETAKAGGLGSTGRS